MNEFYLTVIPVLFVAQPPDFNVLPLVNALPWVTIYRLGVFERHSVVWTLMSVRLTIMLKLLLGDPNARKLKRYQPIVSDIGLLEDEISPLTDDDLSRNGFFLPKSAWTMLERFRINDRFLMRFSQKLCRGP